MADRFECLLPIDPPADGTEWWQPTLDDDPGPKVRAVARFGEETGSTAGGAPS